MWGTSGLAADAEEAVGKDIAAVGKTTGIFVNNERLMCIWDKG